MTRVTCIVILLLQLFNIINSEGYYTITASTTIRPYSKYHVAVSIRGSLEPCTIKVGIASKSYIFDHIVVVQPNSVELVQFDLPSLVKDEYKLIVEGVSGIRFEDSSILIFDDKKYTVLIQTDKAMYKPGDLVKYRAIILDANTRPVIVEDDINVSIQDAKENKIKYIKKVTLTKGVFSGELQLPSIPVLGNWEILVEVDGKSHKKSFEVAEYVLPKFEVTIDTNQHLTYGDGKLRATVRAKYTYGKPIVGMATVSLFSKLPNLNKWNENIVSTLSRKTVPLDGKARVEFDITNEMQLNSDISSQDIKIEAEVEDTLTGRKQNGTTYVKIHLHKYKFVPFEEKIYFTPGVRFNFKVKVVYHDGSPVQDTTTPVTVAWQNYRFDDYNIKKFYMDQNGIVTFNMVLDVDQQLMARYRDLEQYIGDFYARSGENQLQINILTENPKVNNDVFVRVEFNHRMRYFIYNVVGRGDILYSKVVVARNRYSYIFKFPANFTMLPSAVLCIHFVHEGEIVSEEKTINFSEELLNFIKIETPSKASPGENVSITVTTNPNSYVGLLGVDQSVLLLNSGNDLSTSSIFEELRQFESKYQYRSSNPYYYDDYGYSFSHSRNPGKESKVVLLTNAYPLQFDTDRSYYDRSYSMIQLRSMANEDSDREPVITSSRRYPERMPSHIFEEKPKQIAPILTRKEFPETWIWELDDNVNSEGQTTIHKKVPDTITSWVITGFSINPLTGLGLTRSSRKLQVFQPFFVTTNLPYSVKRGEVISIPVIVFNYMDEDLEAEVTLDNSLDEFEFTEATNEVVVDPIHLVSRTKSVTVPSYSGQSLSFMIRPKKVGHITIKITATSPLAGDAVQRLLPVEAEGVPEYFNKAVLVDLRKQESQIEIVKIEIPANAVADSNHIEVSVVGDLLGPTIKNLDKLIRLPYGCGEQNMVNFVPNILVLNYLNNMNKSTPAIESKAKKYLEVGYQQELSFKHSDGSYSAFGTRDSGGSTWLTAYVARSFRQATKYIQIDESVIRSALGFLAKNQAANGSFPEVGYVIDKQHSSGSDNAVALTSFVLLAFLENDNHFPEYRNVINNALEYISTNTDNSTDIYGLAISTYTLQLANHSSKDTLINVLQYMATIDVNGKYWQLPSSEQETRRSSYYKPRSVNVEITSYALLALLEAGDVFGSLPIHKWLIAQRNENGGFESTQDTVVGLTALIKSARKLSATETNVQFQFSHDLGEVEAIVNDDTAMVLQSYEVPSSTKELTITATGRGVVLLQVSYKYNVNVTGELPQFKLNPQVNTISTSDYLRLSVCTSFDPNGESSNSSNMAVMEVTFPTGFTSDTDTLKSLETTEHVKKVETKNGDSVIVVYFDSLDLNEICPTFDAHKTHKVAEQKPAAVVVYDYYDNSRHAREFYSGPVSSLCDICEGADCGESCNTGPV